MAAMLMTKNAIVYLSKAFPRTLSMSPRLKVSRVCFASASNPQGYQSTRSGYETGYGGNTSSDTAERTRSAAERTKENMREAADRTKDNMHEAADKTKNKTKEMRDRAEDATEDMTERTKETAGRMADKTKEGANKAAEKTKEGANKAAETAENIGEKAKQTVEGAWDKAKETGQKIKETVVGKSDDDVDDYVEDHRNKPKTMDEDVLGARRRIGDHKM